MKRVKLAALASTLLVAGSMAFAPPALSAPTQQEVQELLQKGGMARQDGMVTKQDFIKMMEKRFDAMDKKKKGMLSEAEIAYILDPRNFM